MANTNRSSAFFIVALVNRSKSLCEQYLYISLKYKKYYISELYPERLQIFVKKIIYTNSAGRDYVGLAHGIKKRGKACVPVPRFVVCVGMTDTKPKAGGWVNPSLC